jgi:ATP-binding cassette, subfamily B, bacterial
MSIGQDSERDVKQTLSTRRIVGIYRLMYGYRWLYLGALIAVALGALVRTFYYRLVQHTLDNIVGNPQALGELPWVAGAFIGLALLEGVFAFYRGIWSAKTAEGITLRVRNYLFDHVQRLPFGFHDYVKAGEMIQRSTSDVDALRRFYADQALGIGRIIALFVVNFGMLMAMNTRLAWVAVAMMPAIIGLGYFFFGRVSKAYEAYQDQEAKLSTVLQENLTGVRVVRAFARQPYEMDKFDRENAEKLLRGRKLVTMHALYWPISDIFCAAQTILAIAVGAGMAARGEITVGTYVAAMGMVVWIIWPMRNLGRLIVQISTGLVSYERVAEVIREEREDIVSGSVPMDTALEGGVVFDHVNFSYEPRPVFGEDEESEKKEKASEQAGKKGFSWFKPRAKVSTNGTDPSAAAPLPHVPVLHDISFRCEPGQVVALLGSTGSGKTSIINLLLRFYDYQEGSVTLDGIELREYPREYLRRNIGIVEQEPFLFSRSIRENIGYGRSTRASQDEIEAAAKAAAIHDIVLTFPQGYDTVVGEKGVTLSGGQRQRVAIARALLKDPRILVLDDATSSVDTETEEQIRDALTLLMEGRTTFLVAHRIQSVMDADLILVLDKGRVVQSGTHDTLVCEPGLYREIYEIQSRIDEEVQREVAQVSELEEPELSTQCMA